jgi:hypothetical protein
VTEKKSPTSSEEVIIKTARAIARLENKQRALRRELADVRIELRTKKRELRAVTQMAIERRPDTPPMRLYGEH